MTATPTLATARKALHALANPKKALTSRVFFKKSKGDTFLGVSTPQRQVIAKTYWELPLPFVRTLMHSKVHEERSLAHALLVLKYRKAENDKARKRVFDFYMKNRRAIRDWDGVDDSAPYIVGPYLMERSKALLHRLIRSPNMWDRRIALVATWPMIRQGEIADILKLAAQVLDDAEDLIHKATGWMLREVGKKDMAALKRFLRRHHARLPRTALRYAIERFPKAERLRYLKGTF